MERAIGVIDSGVGGLTVAQELMRQLPKEELIYLGDTKRCPYGPRSEAEIKQFTWEMVRFLMKFDIKILVVACNTATAFTLPSLQEELDIPVVGVIQPGARAAIKATRNNQVGIIGTEGTIRSGAYHHALKRIKSNIEVHSLACPSFVPMVERGVVSGLEAEETVEKSLGSLRDDTQIDTLILGCTHYPLIASTIQKVLGEDVKIVSSSGETARETSTILDVHQLLYKGNRIPDHQLYTTGDLSLFTQITERIFKHSVNGIHKMTRRKTTL